jgi:hypothetical protein
MNPENTTLRSYLADLVDLAAWNWLTDLAKQGKVLFLANHLDLVEVGLALAEDDISKVQEWLADGWIYRPTEEQIFALDQEAAQSDLIFSEDLISSDYSPDDSAADIFTQSPNLDHTLRFESLIVQPFVLAKIKVQK